MKDVFYEAQRSAETLVTNMKLSYRLTEFLLRGVKGASSNSELLHEIQILRLAIRDLKDYQKREK